MKIVVKQTAFDEEHFAAQRVDFVRCPVRAPILRDHLDNDSFKLAAAFCFCDGYVNVVVGLALEVAVHRFAGVGVRITVRQKRDQAHSRSLTHCALGRLDALDLVPLRGRDIDALVHQLYRRALQLREGVERQRGWRSLWWNGSFQLVDQAVSAVGRRTAGRLGRGAGVQGLRTHARLSRSLERNAGQIRFGNLIDVRFQNPSARALWNHDAHILSFAIAHYPAQIRVGVHRRCRGRVRVRRGLEGGFLIRRHFAEHRGVLLCDNG